MTTPRPAPTGPAWLDRLIRFSLEQKLVGFVLLIGLLGWGIAVAPFGWDLGDLPRNPVPVDAIPDIGENQQIVFTEWPGQSPQDVEDQVTYPLTAALLGIPGVKTVRSSSLFGFSSIYVIFEEDVDFYWSRSRVLEKLSSLPADTLPEAVRPALGPDATPLGQVFWYTLEGRDPDGNPTGGWDLDELRSVQDWYVRYALQSAEGVSEVASVGGFVREYQVDVDPDAMRAYGVSLEQVFRSVRRSNSEVGARTIEVNRVEYVIRGIGFLDSVADIEASVVTARDGVPVRVRDVARVGLGPALRRGALDKGGAEVVGGVVVVRYGANPLQVIENVKSKIAEISPGLPERVLEDGTPSRVAIVPFYDRTDLIHETLGTLEHALRLEILVTILVVLVMLRHLRSSLLIAGTLPLAVLLAFVAMKLFGIDANIVALSGIAIAIGTMVDMGVVLSENILRRLAQAEPGESRAEVIHRAATEVGGAVVTAVATTVVSFLPVFALQSAEGKLFRPLAYTKTFALIAAVMVALIWIPPFAQLLLGRSARLDALRARVERARLLQRLPAFLQPERALGLLLILAVGVALTLVWRPLGAGSGVIRNALFLLVTVGGVLLGLIFYQRRFERWLGWCLEHKAAFLSIPVAIVGIALLVWLGFRSIFGWLPEPLLESAPGRLVAQGFPGLGREFMPPLDEGSFLFMPTTMPHASIGEAADVLRKLDLAIESVPEVELAVGKLGRVESALDPAPISMIETVVHYKPEYGVDESGERVRLWRPEIRSPDDIWREIVRAARLPGTTSASRLQPIAARLVMLQSGIRAPMAVRLQGPDLETLEGVGLQVERILKRVPEVDAGAVFADRIVGKPYLEIHPDREAIARYGLHIQDIQDVIAVGIGGRPVTTTVEGRERYPVRLRYQRERRDRIETLGEIPVATPGGAQVPLSELASIEYVRGPQAIRSEDTFLVSYVLFDRSEGHAEVDAVEAAAAALQSALDSGELELPAGVRYSFAGTYEAQVRSAARLRVILPLSLVVIFLILYLQFGSAAVSLMVFTGIFVAAAGGFLVLWLYAQPWFLNFDLLDASLREVFQVRPFNLSVAVWVGFIALFGIASDNGVLMATYLRQSFRERRPATRAEIRAAVLTAAQRRIRPCMMTTATTILALLPVLSSTGRGSDIMIPMAIPSFGGMVLSLLSLSLVPVLYCGLEEAKLRRRQRKEAS
jgi:Cu(I)/Ag(I) efflux system membrane protein CusA/SilA